MITENLETLRQVSDPFDGEKEELQALIETLEGELKQSQKIGVGLSAIQISIPQRVAIIRIERKYKKRKYVEKYDLWNAEIIEADQQFLFEGEGCLSLPGKKGDTLRYNRIKVKNGDGEIISLSGYSAVVVQHELDHWDGILFTDRAPVKEENLEKANSISD